ncbi:MAG: AmmeMemoRadiSam system radical SAM enzyme [Candidatus Margulisiibacteriota bacterium]
MKEALFYEKLAGSRVKCDLCPHYCIISEGKRGLCGVRENQKGILYSLVYGKLAAANIDPIEKKPLFHFLHGTLSYSISTVGCNFHCDFCQNYYISQAARMKEILGDEVPPEKIVEAAIDNKCPSISYTYTEPTVYFEYAFETAKIAKEKGLKNIFVTNGYINREPLERIAPFLDAANVDLKSFSDEFYRKICGGKLAPVLETLKLMKTKGIWIEIATLIIPGLNDSDEELNKIANFIKNELGSETPWHVTGFYPTYKMLDRPRTSVETLIKARGIGIKAGLKNVYIGNVAI